MKKIFGFLVLCLLFCSCQSVTTCIGNVTAYNSNGTILKKWENVVIEQSVNETKQSSIKDYGVNFYDNKNENYVIIGNSVPYIIEYKSYNNNSDYSTYNGVKIPYNITKEQKELYIREYKELKKEMADTKKELKYKGADKNSEFYNKLIEKKKNISERMKELETIFYCRNISFR